MDTVLHCNELDCRANVPDQAVVTTCSHIFCIPCANRLGLVDPQDGVRRCPACKTDLPGVDDAVITSLQPTEEYKTSILSGMNPTVIMECAGRGMNFWNYQLVQEITFQEYKVTSLTERYGQLHAHLEGIANKEKEDNKRLRQQMNALQAENANLIENNQALDRSYKDKARAHQQISTLYQKLKTQQLAAGLELAADVDADNVLAHASQQGRANANQRSNHSKNVHGREHSDGSSGSNERRDRNRDYGYMANNASQGYQADAAPRAGLGTSHSLRVGTPQQTASRQRLPQPTFGAYNSTITGMGNANIGNAGMGTASLRQGTPNRAAYGNQHGYVQSGHGGNGGISGRYGGTTLGSMSAGMRMSRPPLANMPLSRAGARQGGPSGYSGMNVR